MTTHQQDMRHLAGVTARHLQREARAAARAREAGSPDWHFYHGVMEAALDQIHPERALVHGDSDWLEARPPSFQSGFLKGSTLLARAATAPDLPVQVRLPTPRAPSHRSPPSG